MIFDLSRFDPAGFTGVPDAAVRQFALPPYGFVRSWVEYMTPCTDAPIVYHAGVALSMVATLVPPSVALPDGDELPANLFTLLVGPSTRSRKTHAIAQGRKALTKVAPLALMSDDGSGEGFADAILQNPRRLIVSEEGGQFLQHTMGGNYGSSLRSRLTALADASPIERHTSKRGGRGNAPGSIDTRREENPRVGMLIACTPTHLEEHTFKLDWEGGFLSRFLILYSQRERNMQKALLDAEGRTRMEQYLAAFAAVGSVGPCIGLTRAAEAYYEAWQNRLAAHADAPNSVIPVEAAGVIERTQRHARKAALILAYDRHVSRTAQDPGGVSQLREQAWAVDLDDVRVGCALGDFHVASVLRLRLNISDNPDGQVMRRIRNFVAVAPDGFRTYGEIVRYLDRLHKTVGAYLETLCIAGTLQRGSDASSSHLYWLVGTRASPTEAEVKQHSYANRDERGTPH